MSRPDDPETASELPFLASRIAELKQDLLERDRAAAALRTQNERLNADLMSRDQLLEKMQSEIQRLQSELAERQKSIDVLLASRSWRVTAILRFLGTAYRRTLHAFTRLPHMPVPSHSKEDVEATAPIVREMGQELTAGWERRLSSAVTDSNAERVRFLERAAQMMFSEARDNTGDGTYVHRVEDRVDADRLSIKTIAFYVPEFFPVCAETKYGVGDFTAWKNVSGAVPRYLGQYQPQLPVDLGFYDLRLPEVFRDQVELAKHYGIYGFCFDFYSPAPHPLFNLPLNQILEDPGVNLRFCVRWMGNRRPVTPQTASDSSFENSSLEDEALMIDFVERAFSDPRYIRVDGRPVLVCLSEDRHRFADEGGFWKTRMADWRVYLVGFGASSSGSNMDAVLVDPTHDDAATKTSEYPLIDPEFSGAIYRYADLMEQSSGRSQSEPLLLRNVVTGWDDEARRPGASESFAGSTPALYARWLNRSCLSTMLNRPEERLMFITAWNDWADGAHLEPDRRYGYAYLHATANVLRSYHSDTETDDLIEGINAAFKPTSNVAIIFHCYYEDLAIPILEEYVAGRTNADLFVTVRPDVSREAIQELRNRVPNICFLKSENRGRDIRPFLLALRHIRRLGYSLGCKVHTKKTPQMTRVEGQLWRQRLIGPLLGSRDSTSRIVQLFSEQPDLGLLVPKGCIMDAGLLLYHVENTFWLDRLLKRLKRQDLVGTYSFSFPAGSMYWFRLDALAGFEEVMLEEDPFEYELGQRDGTLAHAIERLVALYVEQSGYSMKEIVTMDIGPDLSIEIAT